MESLQWGFIECDDKNSNQPFILGPDRREDLRYKTSKSNTRNNITTDDKEMEMMLASNLSCGIQVNSVLVSIVDKR